MFLSSKWGFVYQKLEFNDALEDDLTGVSGCATKCSVTIICCFLQLIMPVKGILPIEDWYGYTNLDINDTQLRPIESFMPRSWL